MKDKRWVNYSKRGVDFKALQKVEFDPKRGKQKGQDEVTELMKKGLKRVKIAVDY